MPTLRRLEYLVAISQHRNFHKAAHAAGVSQPTLSQQIRLLEKELRELYSHCRAVFFPPLAEDYGYIAIEAMLSGKAVITCVDSGGPLEFVRHGETGWVAEAAPLSLAAVLDTVAADPATAATLGRQAQESIHQLGINWERTLAALLGPP